MSRVVCFGQGSRRYRNIFTLSTRIYRSTETVCVITMNSFPRETDRRKKKLFQRRRHARSWRERRYNGSEQSWRISMCPSCGEKLCSNCSAVHKMSIRTETRQAIEIGDQQTEQRLWNRSSFCDKRSSILMRRGLPKG